MRSAASGCQSGTQQTEFRILGPIEVAAGDRMLPLGGAKQRGLLAILLFSANEVVSSDRLIDELWAEDAPRSGRTALHVRISQLRKALGPAGHQLVTRAPGYTLRIDDGQLDLHRFQRLVREADAADPAGASTKLHEALALWRGQPLADLCYEPFTQSAIARLQELRLTALEKRLEADLALRRHVNLVAELEALVTEHPRRERLRVQLMLALYHSGRHADALDCYARARTHLSDELGLEPGPELKALQTAILNHDPSLTPHSGPSQWARVEGKPHPSASLTLPRQPHVSATSRRLRRMVMVLSSDAVDSTGFGAKREQEARRNVMSRYLEKMRPVIALHGGPSRTTSVTR